MNTKTLSSRSLSVIDQYLHFQAGTAVCSVPYYNNKVSRVRAALRVNIGKGSPKEIFEELENIVAKARIAPSALADESLKRTLVDSNIGIDCSAFAYYVIGAEFQSTGRGKLDAHLSFARNRGIIGRLRAKLRPVENCDVATLADDSNSEIIETKNIQPGDFIAMLGDASQSERDHVLVIHQVDYQNFSPIKIGYSHAAAYPEDGIYGTGVKQGTIEIADITRPIAEARWTENGKTGDDNPMRRRAQKSRTEIRRIRA